MKKKLSVSEQIKHMKMKGICFDIISEADAADYLEHNNYYFKLKAYAKNYAKYQIGEKAGKYVNLEFAYLKDMAIIDMLLRQFIMEASTDIEHAVKVRFLSDFNSSPDDGYEYVNEYLKAYPDVLETIKKKKGNSYTNDLTEKLLAEGFAIWSIIELLSLKDCLKLYKGFYEKYPKALNGYNLYYPMQGVRKLRNAAAHNNCLINTLRKPYSGKNSYNSKVDRFIANTGAIGKKSRNTYKSNQVIYDFVTLLYMIDEVIYSPKMKQKIISELYELFHGRMVKHAEYYKKESAITGAYNYTCKIVDSMYEKNYNIDVI